MGQSSKDVVLAAYAAFGRGDIPGLLELVAVDVVWVIPGEGVIPQGGTWRGREGVAQFFAAMDSSTQVTKFEPKQFIVEGDMTVAIIDLHGIVRSTGQEYQSELVHIFTVTNGKIKRFAEYFDTLSLMPPQ